MCSITMCKREGLAAALASLLTIIFILIVVWIMCRVRKRKGLVCPMQDAHTGQVNHENATERLDCQSPLPRDKTPAELHAMRRRAFEGRVYYTPADASLDTGSSSSGSSSENDE